MEFLQQFIQARGIQLSPIPWHKLSSALVRSWKRVVSTSNLQALLTELVRHGHIHLDDLGLLMRTWDARSFGELKLVRTQEGFQLAERLDANGLPDGRTVPGDSGVWYSVLGTSTILGQESTLDMCVHFFFKNNIYEYAQSSSQDRVLADKTLTSPLLLCQHLS
jgi:hypothetical protein